MKTTKNNPINNRLGAGVTETKVEEAVLKSGFPLQTRVAALLESKQFYVQEEWAYKDIDTNEDRTMDILASQYFKSKEPHNKSHIYPVLDIIIECKKHELPYIFFLSEGNRIKDFPTLSGFPKDGITITTDDDPSSYEFSYLQAFGLTEHPFFKSGPNYCTSFTKCVRKGTDLDLSGEAYSSLVLPLAKASEQLKNKCKPPDPALYYHFPTIVAIGLLEAPMIGVKVTEEAHELIAVPWVRLIKHEPIEENHPFFLPNVHAIELIHKDYFSDYLSTQLIPFFEELSLLSFKHEKELITGEGFVSGMEKDSWNKVEERLKPQSLPSKSKRVLALGRNIAKLALRKPLN